VETAERRPRSQSRPKAGGASRPWNFGLPDHAAQRPLGRFSSNNRRSRANPHSPHAGGKPAGDRPCNSRPPAALVSVPDLDGRRVILHRATVNIVLYDFLHIYSVSKRFPPPRCCAPLESRAGGVLSSQGSRHVTRSVTGPGRTSLDRG
jgi:hypothetical protein